MFGAPDIAEEKATVDEYESGNTEEKVMSLPSFIPYYSQ